MRIDESEEQLKFVVEKYNKVQSINNRIYIKKVRGGVDAIRRKRCIQNER